jgi:hypothetical protein
MDAAIALVLLRLLLLLSLTAPRRGRRLVYAVALCDSIGIVKVEEITNLDQRNHQTSNTMNIIECDVALRGKRSYGLG